MIGPHIIGSIGERRELIHRWQPRVALLLDSEAGAAFNSGIRGPIAEGPALTP